MRSLSSSDNHAETLTVREAGQKGGMIVFGKYGREFFSRIGRRGQQAMRSKYPGMAREWGMRGGRPKKPEFVDGGEGALNSQEGG